MQRRGEMNDDDNDNNNKTNIIKNNTNDKSDCKRDAHYLYENE